MFRLRLPFLILILCGFSAAHGAEVPDPYRWLEDADSSRTQTWVRDQNQQAEVYLNAIPGREKISARLRELYQADSVSLPAEAGARLFYKRTRKDQDQPVFDWRPAHGQTGEKLWLDPAAIGGHSTVGEWVPSPDGKLVAYALHQAGADEAVLNVRDIERNVDLSGDVIPGANFASVSWSADSRGFYYMQTPVDPSIPAAERVAFAVIRFHPIGQSPALDPLIYPATHDASRYLSPQVSEDGKWLFIEDARGWTSNDIYVSRLGLPGEKRIFQPLFISTSAVASVSEWRDHFYLFTNQNASNGKILERAAQESAWRSLIPEQHDAVIESMHIVGGYIVLVVLKNAADRVEVFNSKGEKIWEIPLPQEGKVWDVSGREDQDDLYIEYESYFVPTCIFHAQLSRQKLDIWEKTNIPLDVSRFETDLVWYTSKDGTKVSMMVVRPKNLVKNGSTPVLLEGYGGFNTPILPRFSEEVVALLEMGGIYAAPHLRGGGEYGEAWHQAGMLTRKQNTFDDFIAAAEYLIKERYTNPNHLAIQGVSNGGLLVSAVLTQRPDLFRAAICKNPLTDMIRYPLFGEGKAWVPEYGSPQNSDQFVALLAYSPYHHVTKASYPSLLMFAGEHDDRVDPMHARKFTAALQAANTSTHPILFRLLLNSGHRSSDHLTTQINETTDRLLFLANELAIQ